MSYRTRYHLIILGIPVLFLLSWKLSISRTAEVHKEYRKALNTQLLYTDPDRMLYGLQQELTSIRERDVADPDMLDQRLMEEVSMKTGPYMIRLEAFPETHTFQSENYQVQTFRIRLSGKYANLLRFINYSEYEIKSCSMVSVSFEHKVLRKTGEILYADLYYQSVFKTKTIEQ